MIELPYGNARMRIAVPEHNLAWVHGPQRVPGLPDVPAAVARALRSPIGAPSLADLVRKHGKKTVILVDDGTRPTPQHEILPAVLNELNAAGVGDGDISVLIGLGTHRPMARGECIEKYGRQVCERVRIENLSQDPKDFEDLGRTPSGIPVQISKPYLRCPLSIAVGNIVPHMYAGWAGGAKMIQPGVSSALTTARTHLMAGPNVHRILGRVENPVRREMEQIAVQSGLKFILNVVLNHESRVVAAVAGHPIEAHRRGVQIARPIYAIDPAETPDIVIAGSHPADRDLWQGIKPLNSCGLFVREGGTLILCIPAPEGIAPDHPEFVSFGRATAEQVLALLQRGEATDEVAVATYLAMERTRRALDIVLVSGGIRDADARKIGLRATADFPSALSLAMSRHGNDCRIGVMTEGADVFCPSR
ncbi:MAG: nickel-dependent lactate racemase [Kiritimatiellae bacterium]|nr:nickel-dependent lactate racemase [Kiritimatiellia bacterium]